MKTESVCVLAKRPPNKNADQAVTGIAVITGNGGFLTDVSCPQVRLPFADYDGTQKDLAFQQFSSSIDIDLLYVGVYLARVEFWTHRRAETTSEPYVDLVRVVAFERFRDERLAARFGGRAYRPPSTR